MNSTLTTISLLTDESERLMQPLVIPEGREHFKRYFRKMRSEFETLSTVTKSIVSLSKVMYDNYEGFQSPPPSETELPPAKKASHQKTIREH